MEEIFEFFVGDAGENSRIGNLPPIEMENGEHGTIGDGIEKLVRVPGGSERGGFGFAIADDAGNDEIGIVKGGAVRMQQRVAEFAAFIDRSGNIGSIMRGNAVGPGELAKE